MPDKGFTSLGLRGAEPTAALQPQLALSLYAPWVWAILWWTKRIENRGRTFPRRYTGTVWLHASLFGKKPEDMLEEWHSVKSMAERAKAPRPERPVSIRDLQEMRGHIVGRVTVTGYVDESKDGWFVGPTGLLLADPVPLVKPVPCKGAIGFWRVPENVRGELMAKGAVL